MGPEEERELIEYLESVIASHPLKQPSYREEPEAEEAAAEGAAPLPRAADRHGLDFAADIGASPTIQGAQPFDEPRTVDGPPAVEEAPAVEEPPVADDDTTSGDRPMNVFRQPAAGPDLGERGAGLRLLWGAAPARPPEPEPPPVGPDAVHEPAQPQAEPSPAPAGGAEPSPTPAGAQALYDRLQRPMPEAMDQLQAVGISRATVARTGIRWTGESGVYARHLAFPLKLGGVVRQLQFWPLEGRGGPIDNLTLTADEFGPPDGLFGVLPPPGEAVYLTETPLDALSLNEQGFPAVAAFQGLPPTATTAAELRGRAVYIVSADDATGEAWRSAWHERLDGQEVEWVDVVLPFEVDDVAIQGAHDLLRALPLGFAFADAVRTLVAEAEAAARAGGEAIAEPAVAEAPAAERAAAAEPAVAETPAAERAAGTEALRPEPSEWKPPAAVAAEGQAPSDRGAPPPAVPIDPTLPVADTEAEDAEHSTFYLSFLEEHETIPDQLAPTGLEELNERLAGGFDRGLYVLAGEPGTGKTAFLEDMAIDATTRGRPVIYYALKEGSRSTWERMISRLSRIMGEHPLSLPDLRGGRLDHEDLATLAELDRVFRVAVLPRLTLLDTVPGGPDPVISFLSDLRRRIADRSRAFRRTPLVLVDDLQYLLLTLNADERSRAAHVVLGMNDLLSASRSPAVLTSAWPSGWSGSTTDEPAETQPDHLAEGLLVLRSPGLWGEESRTRLGLEIVKNGRTGWLGRLELILDRRSGLLWSAQDGEADDEPSAPTGKRGGRRGLARGHLPTLEHLQEALELAHGPCPVVQALVVVVGLQQQRGHSLAVLQQPLELGLHQAERLAAAVGVEDDAVHRVPVDQLGQQIVALTDLDVEETRTDGGGEVAQGVIRVDGPHVARAPGLGVGVDDEVGALLGQLVEQLEVVPEGQVVPQQPVAFVGDRREAAVDPVLDLVAQATQMIHVRLGPPQRDHREHVGEDVGGGDGARAGPA